MRAWGRWLARHRWWVLAGWAVLVALLAHFSANTPHLLSPSGFSSDTEAARTADLIRKDFPERRFASLYVVFRSDNTLISDPTYQEQVAAWQVDLQRLTEGTDAQIQGPLPGRDGLTTALVVYSNDIGDQALGLSRRTHSIHHPGPARTYLGGGGAVYDAFVTDSEADLQNSERWSAMVAVALLLLVFGGLVAAGLPVVTGLATVIVAIALLGFATHLHTISVFALNISSVLGVGLGIDYSLLVVNRFREELRRGESTEEAVATTVATAGIATVISGGTVMIGFGALLLSQLNVLWSIGLGGLLVVTVSVAASLSLIPALLAIFGGGIDRLSLPITRGRDTGPFWTALASIVMRRPLVFIALTLSVILVLSWPARALNPGVVGAESLPPDDPTFKAETLSQAELGFLRFSPILVIAQGVPDAAAADRVEAELRRAAPAQTVRGPSDAPPELLPLFLRRERCTAIFEIDQSAPDNDRTTRALVSRLRGGHWPPGVTVKLGGEAAAYQDFLTLLLSEFPKIFALVVGLTLLLLGISFRSLALPLKAVLMNLLSISAAMGVLTWIFQEGHLSAQLNFRAVGFVEATIPVIIFAGLFGLSMDYEVFLLSRIREEYMRGLDNTRAVAAGMARTGQIITSAALILVAVASTLDFSHLALNKSLGVTFAIAIFLDATLIRLLLVPAMMRMLGELNWWPARYSHVHTDNTL